MTIYGRMQLLGESWLSCVTLDDKLFDEYFTIFLTKLTDRRQCKLLSLPILPKYISKVMGM